MAEYYSDTALAAQQAETGRSTAGLGRCLFHYMVIYDSVIRIEIENLIGLAGERLKTVASQSFEMRDEAL